MLKKLFCILISVLMVFSAQTAVFGEEKANEQGSIEGEKLFHSPKKLYYQASSHNVGYEPKTFILIPEYSENWEPNTVNWNGKANANYLVAYCADNGTGSSTSGTEYNVYTIDNSRFKNDEQRRKMAGIIGNSYPFLTAEEMRENLSAAAKAGEITEEILDCTESEWIAATQWAIWDTTALVWMFDESDVVGAEFPEGHPENYLNPLTDAGHTETEHYQKHVKALRDWLCTKTAPEKPKVESFDYKITEGFLGLKNLSVTVSLNRKAENGETISFCLSAGNRKTESKTLSAGEKSFSVTLENLSGKELSASEVFLEISGEHMQAYFYESENYQDMIGGNYEQYFYDLSFKIGSEKTSVSVLKTWTEGVPEDIESVKVSLFANGKAIDEVSVGSENNWYFCWEGLNKFDANGNEIVYSVEEKIPEGYDSAVTSVKNYEGTAIIVWKKTETFDGEGEYLFLSETGALSASFFNEEYYMNASPADISGEVSKTNEKSVWKLTAAEGGYFVESKAYPGQYMNFYYSYGQINENKDSPLNFENGLLFKNFKSYKRYFQGFYSDGYQYLARTEEKATPLSLYKAVEIELPSAEINFVITNTKTPKNEQPEEPEIPKTPEVPKDPEQPGIIIKEGDEIAPDTGAPA